MNNIAAIVKNLVGQVFAVSLDGLKRQIFEGERLLGGEQVMTGLGGEVTLQLASGEVISVGQGGSWQAPITEEEAGESAVDSDLEQALAAGFDPTTDLEAPAAGPGTGGGAGGGAGGGHSFVMLDTVGGQLDPTIGFETAGLGFAGEGQDELLGFGGDADAAALQPNRAPTAQDDTFTLNEDGTISIDVLANDSDLDGDTLSISQVNGQAISEGGSVIVGNGSVTLSNGQLIFTPDADYNGPASFTYTITDGVLSSTATVSGTINPVNDAPTVDAPLTATANEDGAIFNVDLLAGASDVDNGDVLSVSSVQGLTNGLTLNGNSLVVDPADASFQSLAAGETREVTVTYDVIDSNGGTTPQSLTLTITGTNDAPTLTGVRSSFNYNENQNAGIRYTRLDGDVTLADIDSSNFDGGSLTVSIGNAVADQDILIVQNQGNGVGQIRVIGTDVRYNAGSGSESIGTISGGTGGAPLVISLNDKATPAAVEALLQRVAYGNSSQAPDSTPRNVSITVVDGDGTANGGTDSVTHNMVINVRPGNDAPVNTVPASIDVTEDVASAITGISITDVDAGNAAVSVTLSVPTGSLSATSANGVTVTGSPSSLVLTGSISDINTFIGNSSVTYTTAQDANGTVTLTVTTNDLGNTGLGGAKSDTDTVTLNITPVNDAPVANNDGSSIAPDAFTVAEDGSVTIDVLANDTDVDSPSLTITEINGSAITEGGSVAVSNGSVSLVGGQLVFTPTADYSGPASFSYTVSDGELSSSADVYGTVTPVADAPNLSLTGTTVAAATDFENVDLGGANWSAGINVSSLNNGLGGTWNTDNSGNRLEIGTQSTYMGGGSTNKVIELERNTGDASNLYTVISGKEGETYSLDFQYSPRNGQTSNSDIQVFWGGNLITTLSSNSVGFQDFHFDLPISADGDYRLEFKATDSNSVGGLLDNISLSNVRDIGNEDSWIRLSEINASLNDTDGSETLSVSVSDIPVGASLKDNAGNTFTATTGSTQVDISTWDKSTLSLLPPSNFNGDIALTVTATATETNTSPALTASETQTLNVTVMPVNDLPVIGGDAEGAVTEDTSTPNLTDTGTLTISDVDAGQSVFQTSGITASAGALGNLTITTAGTWTYTVANADVQYLTEGETKEETFTVLSADGTPHDVVIIITGTNDAAVIGGTDSGLVKEDTTLTTGGTLTATDVDGTDNAFTPSTQTGTYGSLELGANGVWTYTLDNAAANVQALTEGQTETETFTVTAADGTEHSITVEVVGTNENTPPLAQDDGYTAIQGLFAEYFGYAEGPDGANLTNLSLVRNFIEGRTADATFNATSLDYGPLSNASGLGNGTNLQSFIGSNGNSLSADPGNTSDAIIKMSGYIEMAAGEYQFRVTADDGYSIRINGVVVAEFNNIQSTNTNEGVVFTIGADQAGPQQVEIIYWDQGGQARLQVELSQDGGPYSVVGGSALTHVAEDSPFVVEGGDSLAIEASTLLGNDSDPDSDPLSMVSVQDAVNGTVSLNDSGQVIFTPADGFYGDASFTYTITDGQGGTDTATVTLKVTSPDGIVQVGGGGSQDNGDNTVNGGAGDDVLLGDVGGTLTSTQPGSDYNIALVVDMSGSMNSTRVALVKASLQNLANQLKDHDGVINISLVRFSDGATINADIDDLSDANVNTLLTAITNLSASGQTNYEAAFNTAVNWFNGQASDGKGISDGYENLTFFLTDGDPTRYLNSSGSSTNSGGNYSILSESIAAFAPLSGISTVHAIGIGTGVNETYLRFFDNTTLSGQGAVGFNATTLFDFNSSGGVNNPSNWTDKTGSVARNNNELRIRDNVSGSAGATSPTFALNASQADDGFGFEFRTENFTEGDTFTWALQKQSGSTWANVTNATGTFTSAQATDLSVYTAAEGAGTYRFVFTVTDNTSNGDNATVYIDNIVRYDNLATGPLGTVDIVTTADQLNAALQGGAAALELVPVGDDIINGGTGQDIIFGDVINTDALPWGVDGNPSKPSDLPSGAGLSALKEFLELKNGIAPSDQDLYDFVRSNHDLFNVAGDTRGGNDELNGGQGNDILYGQGGNDLLIGGEGDDILFGGSGADTFAWQAGDLGNDVIKDFNAGEGDVIDLSDLLSTVDEADLSKYLQLDGENSTLLISTTGAFGTGGEADITIKVENAGGNVLTASDTINSLIASPDPLLKIQD